MKKTFKLLAIFMGSFLVVVTGALGGYFLISQNKTYYIYDVRLVEPVENSKYYVYTDAEREESTGTDGVVNSAISYTSIKNKKVYLTSNNDNYFEIGVYANTSTNTTNVELSSSNPSVANVVYRGTKCYIYYYKEGVATITANVSGVTDSIDVYVYNSLAKEISIYDNAYYGKFAGIYENKLVAYSDMIEYQYDYSATNAFNNNQDEINNSLIRVDQTSIDETIFNKVSIDSKNKKLILQCKSDLTEEKNTRLVIQSYYIDSDGNERLSQTPCYVDVRVIAYAPEFVQVEVSGTPDFKDACMFMNTEYVAESLLTEENVKNDPTLLEKYLSYQKAEQYLALNGEKSVYQSFFNEKVNTIYIRFRKVYTNGDIVYLNPLGVEKNPFEIAFANATDSNYLKVASNEKFYTLTLSADYFEAAEHPTFNFTLKLSDFDLNHEFKFEYASIADAANLPKYFNYNKETKVFTYKYWDKRAIFKNAVCDEAGNIIGFDGLDVDLNLFD